MNTPKNYQICRNCVMDTSDPKINFDAEGVCNHCRNFDNKIRPTWNKNLADPAALTNMAQSIKKRSRNKRYDCIIGISGGLDSSFAAHVAVNEMGLNPLLFHVDAGWNTSRAVSNIERVVDGLGCDLITHVVPWSKMREVQISFLKSQIPDQDLPQDAVFFSALYAYARKIGVQSIITGSNYSTECCREPEAWGGYLGIDKSLFKHIHKKFGDGNFEGFPLMDILEYKILNKIMGLRVYHPLNSVAFMKNEAEELLRLRYGWSSFQHKHHESVFTRFYESYYLPKKFGFEKRRAHFSSLIMTGQMSRSKALERLSTSELDAVNEKNELEFVKNKLLLTDDEFDEIFNGPNQTFKNFYNKRNLINFGAKLVKLFGGEKRNLS